MKTKNIFLILLMAPILLTASILELFSLKPLISHIAADREDVIVVFDIDNTLLKSIHQLGSVAWGDSIAADLESKGISKREAQEVVSIFWRTVQPNVKVQAVDPETPHIIRSIQKEKISVICLTARKPEELNNTLNQLQSIGVDLSEAFPFLHPSQTLASISDALYCKGILFATPFNKKSHVFISFLKENNLKPKKVIFIDDKISHVEDVHNALLNEGIECVGIRFGGADEDVKQFNPSIAEMQWKAFPQLLTDEQARAVN